MINAEEYSGDTSAHPAPSLSRLKQPLSIMRTLSESDCEESAVRVGSGLPFLSVFNQLYQSCFVSSKKRKLDLLLGNTSYDSI